MSSEDHVKVHITFPHSETDDTPRGESMWAIKTDKPNHFKIDNLPFYAYGVTLGDIVRCEEVDGYDNEVVEVVEPAPVKMLRIFFAIDDEDTYIGITKGMTDKFGANWERATGRYYSVVVPDESFEEFFEELERLHGKDLLHFETCEQQEEGHFGPGLGDGESEED